MTYKENTKTKTIQELENEIYDDLSKRNCGYIEVENKRIRTIQTIKKKLEKNGYECKIIYWHSGNRGLLVEQQNVVMTKKQRIEEVPVPTPPKMKKVYEGFFGPKADKILLPILFIGLFLSAIAISILSSVIYQ